MQIVSRSTLQCLHKHPTNREQASNDHQRLEQIVGPVNISIPFAFDLKSLTLWHNSNGNSSATLIRYTKHNTGCTENAPLSASRGTIRQYTVGSNTPVRPIPSNPHHLLSSRYSPGSPSTKATGTRVTPFRPVSHRHNYLHSDVHGASLLPAFPVPVAF